MTVHLIKLCVGIEHIDDLRDWHRQRQQVAEQCGEPFLPRHLTRNTPRRAAEILDGGSLYWIIKGFIQARQPVVALEPVVRADGQKACAIVMLPELVEVTQRPHRAFQGWRYLETMDVPADLTRPASRGDRLPDEMTQALRELGLL